MRFVTLIAMFIACLVYGFMPAQASMRMNASMVTGESHAGHQGMDMHQPHAQPYSDPCPHRGGPVHGSFCAACLAIVPQPELARDGRPPFSWPRPLPARELVAEAPAPADPPPRT